MPGPALHPYYPHRGASSHPTVVVNYLTTPYTHLTDSPPVEHLNQISTPFPAAASEQPTLPELPPPTTPTLEHLSDLEQPARVHSPGSNPDFRSDHTGQRPQSPERYRSLLRSSRRGKSVPLNLYNPLSLPIRITGTGTQVDLERKRETDCEAQHHHPHKVIITEIRISSGRAQDISRNLDYTNVHISDVVGFAGGIWLLWNEHDLHCNILATTSRRSMPVSRLVVTLQSLPHGFSLLLMLALLIVLVAYFGTIYKVFAESHNQPWLMLGDFNDLLTNREKQGGLPIRPSRAALFKQFIDRCNLMDLDFSGPRYTWTNLHQPGGIIHERLV
ncbi:hypothetical protein Acr_10g0009240 [Actinidia rufa]|uniref:DNAse I-like superfamily protein n=1 Tax=Actinidia rufa TaxID=165716 RepID=A0A7J0FBI8_9ERIC|nr:hypothetical protein Acr_10g0009240 [Actinidia rufa]